MRDLTAPGGKSWLMSAMAVYKEDEPRAFARVIEQGGRQISKELIALVNRTQSIDLPLVVASIESTAAALRATMDPDALTALKDIRSMTTTVLVDRASLRRRKN